MPRILVVEDSPTQARKFQLMLESAGFETALAANGKLGLEAIAKEKPDVVLTDLQMPEMNGMELVEQVRSRYPYLPVILMTAYGSEEIAVQALKKGAASYIPKNFLADVLIPTLEEVLGEAVTQTDRQRLVHCLANVEYSFVLENDPALVPVLINQLEDDMAHLVLWDQTGLTRVCVCLREALLNAMLHGNLEVGFAPDGEPPAAGQEASTGHRLMMDYLASQHLIEARRQLEPFCHRRVFVRARISRQAGTEFTIRDEGPGFDWAKLAGEGKFPDLEKKYGRGLVLIHAFMDRVQFNDKGNEITMHKKRDGD